MDINKLNFSIFEARLFCAMYKLGSTNEVAKTLEITPSLVSIGINRLEKKLESDKLFRKLPKTGKYVPTQSADEIIDSMTYVVQFAEQAVSKRSKSQNSVTVTSTHTILHYYLGPYIKEFLNKEDNYRISFKETEILTTKTLDINEICITYFVDDSPNKKYFPYHSFRQKLWASPEYIKEFGNPKTVDELKEHTLLLRKNLDDPRALFGSTYIKSQLREADEIKYYNIYSTSLIDDMCQAGCGIMAGAEETIKTAGFKLNNVFPTFKGDEFDLYVCVDKEFFETDLCKKTMNWIFECRDKCLRKANIKPNRQFTPLK